MNFASKIHHRKPLLRKVYAAESRCASWAPILAAPDRPGSATSPTSHRLASPPDRPGSARIGPDRPDLPGLCTPVLPGLCTDWVTPGSRLYRHGRCSRVRVVQISLDSISRPGRPDARILSGSRPDARILSGSRLYRQDPVWIPPGKGGPDQSGFHFPPGSPGLQGRPDARILSGSRLYRQDPVWIPPQLLTTPKH